MKREMSNSVTLDAGPNKTPMMLELHVCTLPNPMTLPGGAARDAAALATREGSGGVSLLNTLPYHLSTPWRGTREGSGGMSIYSQYILVIGHCLITTIHLGFAHLSKHQSPWRGTTCTCTCTCREGSGGMSLLNTCTLPYHLSTPWLRPECAMRSTYFEWRRREQLVSAGKLLMHLLDLIRLRLLPPAHP